MSRGKANDEAERSGQLELGAGARAILGAEIHPFRHPPELWPSLLDAIAELGPTHVVVLLPWSEHEPSEGEPEFGAMRPRLDVRAFLALARDRGLRASLRIGPRVRADLALAGLPEHVTFDRAAMARSARGNAVPSPMPPRIFPWPSYASAAYRAHVRRYFASLASALAGELAPTGIVDSIEIEDAAAVLLRAGAYARDYHPDAIAGYRAFLEERYETPERLSEVWGVRVGRFADVNPPTRFSADAPRDLPRHLDWARYQERCVAEFRTFLRATLVDVGLGRVPSACALDATSAGTPSDVGGAAEALDRVGVELTARIEELASIRRRSTPIGVARARAFARIVVGGSPFGRARSDDDAIACALLAVAHGARDLEFSMTVAHERWWGAPVDVDGARTPLFARYARLLPALRELGLERLHHRPEIAIVVPPEYLRLGRITHLFGPLGAGILDFVGRSFSEATLDGKLGFERPVQTEFFETLRRVEAGLEAARLPFVFVDPRAARALDTVPRLVVCPTFEFVDVETARCLEALVARGARLVIGPTRPTLDDGMNPLDEATHALFPAPTLDDDPSTTTQKLVRLAREHGVEPLPHDPASRALAHPLRDGTGLRGFVAVNPEEVEVAIPLGDVGALRDPLDDAFELVSGEAVLAPRSVRLLLADGTARRPSRPPGPRARRGR